MHSLTISLLLLPASALASFNLLSIDGGGLPEHNGTTNDACVAAYNATIDCDPKIVTSSFSEDDMPTVEELDEICTSQCLTSLRKWVRGGDGCSGEDFLNYFGLNSDSFFDGNGEVNYTTADVQQYYITAAYHSKCLVNLAPKANESKYCILTEEYGFTQAAILNTSNPDALCKDNNCATQSAYLWAPVKTIYEYDPTNQTSTDGDSDLPMLTLDEACPGIDTSNYPLRESDVTAEMLSGTSSGSSSGNSTDSGDKSNAAVGIMVQKVTVMFSVVLAAVGYFVL